MIIFNEVYLAPLFQGPIECLFDKWVSMMLLLLLVVVVKISNFHVLKLQYFFHDQTVY